MSDVLDCKGLKCPQPVLKLAIRSSRISSGTTIDVHADCPSFEDDVRKWCNDSGKVLISVVDHGTYRVATIQF
jgi:tRNA 2-thiouridine synthesizing protein A